MKIEILPFLITLFPVLSILFVTSILNQKRIDMAF